MKQSDPIDLGLTKREVRQAQREVYQHGDRAPGIDGATFKQTFGNGPGCHLYSQTENRLVRERQGFQFLPARKTTTYDAISGKERELTITTLEEQVLLRALTTKLREHVPPTKINCGRPGLDARLSVAHVAVALRTGRLVAQKIDLEKAFDSIAWENVVHAPHAKELLPDHVRQPLSAVMRWYAPDGKGAPTGLPFSPLVLDLVCWKRDQRLGDKYGEAWRYMDDLLVLARDERGAKEAVKIATKELQPFGLRPHPEKTQCYLCNADGHSWRELLDLGPEDEDGFPWLGHEINMAGLIDVGQKPVERLLAGPRDDKRID